MTTRRANLGPSSSMGFSPLEAADVHTKRPASGANARSFGPPEVSVGLSGTRRGFHARSAFGHAASLHLASCIWTVGPRIYPDEPDGLLAALASPSPISASPFPISLEPTDARISRELPTRRRGRCQRPRGPPPPRTLLFRSMRGPDGTPTAP